MPHRQRRRSLGRLDHGGPVTKTIATLVKQNPGMGPTALARLVRRRVKGSRTSARSISSIASRLRAEGFAVPAH